MAADQIMLGVRDSTLQEKLVNTESLTVTKAIKIVTTYQSVQQSVTMIRDPNMAQVHEIHLRGRDASRSFRGHGEFHRPIPRSAGNGYGDRPCPSCLMEYPHRQCPSFGRMCYYCNNMNHFESACRAGTRDQGQGHGFVNRGQGSSHVSQGRGGRSLSYGGQSYSRGSSSRRGNMNYNQAHAVHTEDYSENEGLYNRDNDINAGSSGNLC